MLLLSANCLTFLSKPSSSLRKTTKLPIRQSLFLAVAASIFLTRPVKPSLISRAKIMATGLLPFFHTWQTLSPASSPVTLSGLKGVKWTPGWGPDLRPPAARALPASTAAAREAPRAMRRFMFNEPSTRLEQGPGSPRGRYPPGAGLPALDGLGSRFLQRHSFLH